MKTPTRLMPLFLVGLLFVLMVRTVELTLSSSARRHEQGRWVGHTLEAIARIESVTTLMSELRYQERNEALGLERDNPNPYTNAQKDVEKALDGLRRFTADNPVQQSTIVSVTDQWRAYVTDGEAALRAGQKTTVLGKILSRPHRSLFDKAARLLHEMRAEEVKLLGVRQAALRATLDASDKAVVASAVVMALSLVGIVVLLLREDRARRIAAEAAAREHETNIRLEAANALLARLAATDGLTGLANQRAFRERLDSEVEVAAKFDRPLSLLLFDVDRFKEYNDAFGHPEGDRALRAVARSIEDYTPSSGFAARHGGEEFALLVRANAEEAVRMAQRILQAVENVQWPLRRVTLSAGVANIKGATSAIALMEAADQALYTSKSTGRNRVSLAGQLPPVAPMTGGFVAPPMPDNEAERLAALEESGLLAPWSDADFDALAEAVSRVFGTSIGLVTLVGAENQFFKARVGLEMRGTSRDVSFCAHAMLEEVPMVVPDALADVRFAGNPVVSGDPGIRFYAGAAIRNREGFPLGALCAIDTVPRTPTPKQLEMLKGLAQEASRIVQSKGAFPHSADELAGRL